MEPVSQSSEPETHVWGNSEHTQGSRICYKRGGGGTGRVLDTTLTRRFCSVLGNGRQCSRLNTHPGHIIIVFSFVVIIIINVILGGFVLIFILRASEVHEIEFQPPVNSLWGPTIPSPYLLASWSPLFRSHFLLLYVRVLVGCAPWFSGPLCVTWIWAPFTGTAKVVIFIIAQFWGEHKCWGDWGCRVNQLRGFIELNLCCPADSGSLVTTLGSFSFISFRA